MRVADPMRVDGLNGAPQRCTATTRSGKPCSGPAITGGTVCRMHGGSAPQVKAAARERLMALQPLAIQTLNALLQRDEFPTVQLGAARDVLDRTEGKAKETLKMEVEDTTQMSDADLAKRLAAITAAFKL